MYKKYLVPLVVVLFFLLLFALSSRKNTAQPSPVPSVSTRSTSSAAPIAIRSKTSGCVILDSLPNQACTPGKILEGVGKDQICLAGYAKSVRNVPESEKNEVYAEYNISTRQPGEYEVDHLVSLELGGSNDIDNLWPEPASPTPGFHEKDKVENYLHEQVCSGLMALADAQRIIATNWLEVYRKTQ